MGIPKFYRWISERYPLISQSIYDGSIIPEYDNLYLDFNGIIHRCSHPDDVDPLNNQLTESDMILKMFDYVQKIVQQIKPRKVLIIAVDGVAPRAKMNQQRSRRFRSAQETTESLNKARQRGEDVPNQEDLFDSNCITPGTEFMEKLNAHFEYFIRKKISEDETWRNLNVLFSGHDVPGEGEHKIMSYIRKMKSHELRNSRELDESFVSFHNKVFGDSLPEGTYWDPNETHCFYGLDADLIMLSLVTHEPHFSLLRENALKQVKPEDLTSLSTDLKGKGKRNTSKHTSKNKEDFQLLHISILREYLHEEFKESLNEDDPFEYDLERIIDDFVFMCYFIGNDFLPNLPFLDISEEALNKMFQMYKDNLRTFGNYLTTHGTINPSPCRRFMKHVSMIEKETLGITSFGDEEDSPTEKTKAQQKEFNEMQNRLETLGLSKIDVESQRKTFKDLNPDDVWKQGYYLQKFKKPIEDQSFHQKLRFDYMQGLAWVLKYYYNGCQSWGWFYPYHYAPLASDLLDFDDFGQIEEFPPSAPFEPFQQLLGVLPIASKSLLPVEYQKLMAGNKSPLRKYYPLEFDVDQNGKRNSWEAVVLIPFIDAQVLQKACETHIDQSKISERERLRNRLSENCTWYYFDSNYIGELNATLPGIPPLKNMHTRKEILILPSYETNFQLCEGVLLGKEAPSHFPTMTTLPFTSNLKFAKVSLFRGPSRKDTLIISVKKEPLWYTPPTPYADMDDDDGFITEEEVTEKEIEYQRELAIEKNKAMEITQLLGEELIGTVVFSNWPYHEEARVLEVCCKHILVQKDRAIPFSPESWEKLEKNVSNEFVKKRGIELGPLQVLVRVEPIVGMQRTKQGGLHKSFDKEAAYWQPYQVLVSSIQNQDQRFVEISKQTIEELFPLGSNVVITHKKFLGSTGKVIQHCGSSCNVIFKPLPNLPSFPKKFHHVYATESFALGDISRRIGESAKVISQIAGEVWIKRTNVGLCLKYSSRNEKVLGYSERKGNQWFFTQKAIDLIQEYHNLFPEVFAGLKAQDSNNSGFSNTSELFPGCNKPDERFKALKKWINSLHLSSLTHISCLEDSMSPESALSTERELQNYCRRIAKDTEPLTQQFTRNALQGPMFGLLITQKPTDPVRVGDFVCYMRSSSGPPFGSLAVVVAVNGDASLVSLLFAEEFIGGTDLDGLCSSYRCLKNVEIRYCLILPSKNYFPKPAKDNSTKKEATVVILRRSVDSSTKTATNKSTPTQSNLSQSDEPSSKAQPPSKESHTKTTQKRVQKKKTPKNVSKPTEKIAKPLQEQKKPSQDAKEKKQGKKKSENQQMRKDTASFHGNPSPNPSGNPSAYVLAHQHPVHAPKLTDNPLLTPDMIRNNVPFVAAPSNQQTNQGQQFNITLQEEPLKMLTPEEIRAGPVPSQIPQGNESFNYMMQGMPFAQPYMHVPIRGIPPQGTFPAGAQGFYPMAPGPRFYPNYPQQGSISPYARPPGAQTISQAQQRPQSDSSPKQ